LSKNFISVRSFAFFCISGLMFLFLIQLPGVAEQKRPGAGYDFKTNGKVEGSAFSAMYQKSVPEFAAIEVSENFRRAAGTNYAYLKKMSDNRLLKAGNLEFSAKSLKKCARLINEYARNRSISNFEAFDFFQIEGEDKKGNVHFTGYFTPLLKARKVPDEEFCYPIYSMPKDQKLPSREAIDHQNALSKKGLELAYTNSLLDNFFLSVQGSGVLEFEDGNRKYIGYSGQNGYRYQSIGRILVSKGFIPAEKISLNSIREWFDQNPDQMIPILNMNPSYVFFKWRPAIVTGAAGLNMIPMHSVAVDNTCIVHGSVLLAEVPILDSKGQFIKHEHRILFAHDSGGAIKGPGHIDLYFGIGDGKAAGDLHHYGRVWLLLAK
jgi:membrane-bound lytic murein transglycosylase A